MSDIHEQEDITIHLQSGRFKILSENNEYKDFRGLATANPSEYLYEVDNFLYTEKHTFIINNKEVLAKDIGIKTNHKEQVYEILHVDDYHTYISNNKINKNCLLLDEFAFLTDALATEFINSVFPTISSAKEKKNSKIIILSTPNGMNAFYRIYQKASAGLNDFIPFKIDWEDIPRSVSNEDFERNQVNTIGEASFRQEYGCVAEDTYITIRHKDSGEEKQVTVKELEELLGV